MENLSEYYRISRWIAEEVAGTILPEEKERLEAWLQEDPGNRQIYARIVSRLEKGEETKSYRYAPAVQADWKRVERQIRQGHGGRKIGESVWRYVAVAVVVLGMSFAFFLFRHSGTVQVNSLAKQEVIPSGSSKAVLTLANGEKVVLEETLADSIQADGILIEKERGGLAYQQNQEEVENEREIFNMIHIPKGGEYRLTLADGTKVWVNSASEMRYPVKFIGRERVVYIKGEVYFEVAENPEKPFIVKTTDNMEIKVLGTHFNVSAYEEDPVIETTLAEGKVVVSDGEQVVNLVPDQQAVFEKAGKHFSCREVDAYQYLAWKDGKFIFERETLENIMEKLSRWYNVEVFFKGNALRQLRFSGDLEKYDDFSTAVRMLEKVSRIRVEIKGKAIFIEER